MKTDTADTPPADKKAPNPRRVAAGRLNRAKRGPLSAETRERLRQAALARKPWQHSTGPRTAAGKAKVALNGRANRKVNISKRAVRRELAGLRSLVADMRAARKLAGDDR